MAQFTLGNRDTAEREGFQCRELKETPQEEHKINSLITLRKYFLGVGFIFFQYPVHLFNSSQLKIFISQHSKESVSL